MKQVTQHNKTGEVRVERVLVPALKAGHVLVQTQFSVISAGTEKASIENRRSSLLQKARRQPELVRKVLEQVKQYGLIHTYRRVKSQLESRAPIGYSAAGIVVAFGDGVSEFKTGDRVACAGGGYANHAEYILVPKNLCVRVPRGMDLDEAAYTTIGAIALQGIRQADPTLGETIVVIGLGLVGQLTAQLLKANGCVVIGIDVDSTAVKLAKECGADVAMQRDDDIMNVVRSFTKGIGADAVIITAATKRSDPVELAGGLCKEKGRVVLVGDVGLKLPRKPYYEKELEFRLSRSYGPGRYDPNYEEHGQDYPVGYVRWTENRNMQEFLRLVQEKKVDVRKLTTHRFSIEQAASAYRLISDGQMRGRERFIGVLLEYDVQEKEKIDEREKKIFLRQLKGKPSPHALKIGFLGAGNFAQSFLLPNVHRFSGVQLLGVCTGNGLNATNVARNFGFQFATTDPKEVIENPEIGTVFIASRHNLHAGYCIEALKAGKNVFVEKPLALNVDELNDIIKTFQKILQQSSSKSGNKIPQGPILMVGFNRGFSPHAQQAKRFFESAVGPYVIQYRVNAGLVPRSHWTQDPIEGGGRVIGEICHFVDLIRFFTGSTPSKIFAESLSHGGASSSDDDSVAVTLKFQDGSVGVISYLANGDPSVPKEHVEIFSTSRTAVIDNFQRLVLHQGGKKREFKLWKIDKGHREEVRQFLIAARDGASSPIPFDSVVTTTLSTFKIVESLKLGVPVLL